MGVGCVEARSCADYAIDVVGAAAHAADDVVVVVTHPMLETSR